MHGKNQAEVRHHRDNQRVLGKLALIAHVDSQCAHDLVTVNKISVAIDRKATVRVTIVSDTEIGLGGNGQRLKLFGVRRTGLVINVPAIGSSIDHDGVSTGLTESFGGKERSTTVCAVNRDTQAVQICSQRGHEVLNVGFFCPVIVVFNLTNSGACGSIPRSIEELLDLVLDLVRELVAAVRKELDAVVRHGVVRSGDHDAQINRGRGRQVSNGRGGDDTNADNVHSGTCKTCRQRVVEEFAGNSRIATDDSFWFVSRGRATLNCQASCRFTQFQCEGRGQINICQSAYAVSSEQPGHRGSSQIRYRTLQVYPACIKMTRGSNQKVEPRVEVKAKISASRTAKPCVPS